ncbi:major facilitator family transporter [Gordonia spumicola]|uniref:Major facilitator family transporter n=1 Tax=Gordonia spumicola TaxID=589161 RepID=A0A7I9V865_9ACTN|nr:MFS transporter [Gordonia spumicola]GEE01402.1 major facilitator family transporter [Gordonia spumicola]
MKRFAGWQAVSLAVFTAAWGGNEFTPLLVMYRTTTDIAPVAVDLLLFTYVIGIVPALLIGGPLSDRFGRRPLMLPSPLIAAAGSLLLACGSGSVALLSIGRVLSGVALGLAMAVGGSWIKELSDADGASATAGARRAALSLTSGFGIGAGLAAILAQWAPWPNQLSYAVNIALAVISFVALLGAPESRQAVDTGRRLRDDLRIRSARHPRFWVMVAPVAPWVFGACAVAYAVIPAIMTEKTSTWAIAFAGLCCVVGLTAGFFIQTLGRRIDKPGSPRTMVIALAMVVGGLALAIVAANTTSIPIALLAAAVLGCGYGMALISGLLEVQRIAGPDDLGGLTAVFYGLTYLGFASPAIMAAVTERFPSVGYPHMFGFGIAMALLAVAVVVIGNRTSIAGPHSVRPREMEVDLAGAEGSPR